MMGIQPSVRQPALFSYHVDLEPRVAADHLLRQVTAVLDLSFVLPTVRHAYGRSGHVSLDPRVIVKMLLLLFLYNIPSERELMEQIRVRLDFLWFLGFDLESAIPDHSVLSKARTRWGGDVFEQLFVATVRQCVQAGLVDGRLLHIDSTMIKANASKDSVVASGPELVRALRQAYQEQAAKLQVLRPDNEAAAAGVPGTQTAPEPTSAPVRVASEAAPQTGMAGGEPVGSAVASAPLSEPIPSVAAPVPRVQVLPPPPAPLAPMSAAPKPAGQKLPVNCTHISPTDPEAELARSKNGVTELNYKDHRLVDDTHGVITAVAATSANIADGTQLPGLYEQHRTITGLHLAAVTVAGDHHYGTADNYIYCTQEGLRAHLGEVSAHVAERGKLALGQFVYEPATDRLRCPQGHYLVRHQDRPEEQLRVYLIEDPARCAQCPLRAQCTESKRGRSIRRYLQMEVVETARREAHSPAARHSRKRRQHVMEGSFADAVNNHGAKKARWRGLWRQRIQSWLIAAVQNLRTLLRRRVVGPVRAAAAVVVELVVGNAFRLKVVRVAIFWGFAGGEWTIFPGRNPVGAPR
jgi:transposase